MSIAISESGMNFVPFEDGYVFKIEKSQTHRSIEENVKMAEFILLTKSKGGLESIWIVEAKSSSPKPTNEKDFDDFIEEICQKFSNALSLSIAMYLNRFEKYDELPTPFRKVDYGKVEYRLILIVNGHKEEWLNPLSEVLNKSLLSFRKVWSIAKLPIRVINDSIARQERLIQ